MPPRVSAGRPDRVPFGLLTPLEKQLGMVFA
jgi:hypothetical protein